MTLQTRNGGRLTPKTPAGASAGLPTIDTSGMSKEGKLICECLMSRIISYFDAKLADKEQLINDLSSSVEKLKKRVVLLEEAVDDNQAYEKRDTLVLSGDIPEVRADEDCNVLVRTLLTERTGVTISEADISVAHRIGKKRDQGPDKRSVLFKLCRRDAKGKIMAACKEKKPNKFFVNESLTPTRNTIMYVLRQAKKKHPNIFGNCRSQEGSVCVWLPTIGFEGHGNRQYRKSTVNSRRTLDELLSKLISETSGSFVDDWP